VSAKNKYCLTLNYIKLFKMEDKSDEIEWEKVIVQLHAYTVSLTKSRGWFRGLNTKNFTGGKQSEDYVFEAIGRYLKDPKLYDPAKGSLLNFLKYYLIRALISNDLVSAENRTSTDMSLFDCGDEEENYEEKCQAVLEASFDEEIDYFDIMSKIKECISSDKLAEIIFRGLIEENLKRREIIEIHKISPSDYDNGMRRLKTLLKTVAKQFDIKRES